ncbi:hypothetical protein ALC62_08078 [Cyphomyrmex costatus]|uniref:Mos1 transposase HTH domain-containing protein n=1 Tax=Cyphomyrmex costatus TaxID=456900 RepID=A0A151IH88_9HYME|nr:hypothetical protein ALC62_08078 [Cyphomyrmex costatus]
MSSFEKNKRHLRELLIYFYNLKKSAAEAHRLLVKSYDEAALRLRSETSPKYPRVSLFHNKCPIFDKKRQKLIYYSLTYLLLLIYFFY